MPSTNQTTETGGRTISGSLPRPMATIKLTYDSAKEQWTGDLYNGTGDSPLDSKSGSDYLDVLNELVDDHAVRYGKEYPSAMEVRLFA